MKVLTFDSESDGFLDVATLLWCIATVDKDTKEPTLYEPDQIEEGLAALHEADVLAVHGGKRHDLPLFKKLYNWEPKSHQIIIDTVIYSRMLDPKRFNPAGYTGNKPHSIEAWGHRVGRHKPDHTDWSQYSPAMGTRCIEDAVIGDMTLEALEREAGDISGYYEQLRSTSSITS